MKKFLLTILAMTLLISGSIFGQDNAAGGAISEVDNIIFGTESTAEKGKRCNDKKGHKKILNTVYEWEKGKVRVYFGDSISDGNKRIQGVFKEAYDKSLILSRTHGSASYKPWGSTGCTGSAVHYNSAKLKSCNDELALKRAGNAYIEAKKVFSFKADFKEVKTGTAQNGPYCDFYDESVDAYPGKSATPNGVSDPYLKFQYVDLYFKSNRCNTGMKVIKGSEIGSTFKSMSGKKCGKGICKNSSGKTIKLSSGEECTEYFKFDKSTTLTVEAYWVPDYFNFIKVDTKTCKKTENTEVGYISRLSEKFPNAGKLFDDKYMTSRASVNSTEILVRGAGHVFHCKNIPTSTQFKKCVKDYFGRNTDYSCIFKGYQTTVPTGCIKAANFEKGVRYGATWTKPFFDDKEIDKATLASAASKVKPYAVSWSSHSGASKSTSTLHLFRVNNVKSKLTNQDMIDVFGSNEDRMLTIKNSLKNKLKAQNKTASANKSSLPKDFQELNVDSFEAFKKVFSDATGQAWSTVGKSSKAVTLKEGEYCLQVKAPLNGTVWGYKK